ncbi:hypothetical protein M8J76_015568 [Diaphorina citri]|nr:hypothetical protein M8J75_011604 [Diaphorina citri]KAI5741635.1 hypothetical protein M8J76_015568 [Diaphorina citri]
MNPLVIQNLPQSTYLNVGSIVGRSHFKKNIEHDIADNETITHPYPYHGASRDFSKHKITKNQLVAELCYYAVTRNDEHQFRLSIKLSELFITFQ